MKRQLLCAGLSLCCAAAYSEPSTWNFTYTGFYHVEGQLFAPEEQFTGQFSGSDLNANGILEKSELSAFVLPFTFGPADLLACVPEDPYLYWCEVERFTFSEQTGLDFKASISSTDPHDGNGHAIKVTTNETWRHAITSGRSLEVKEWNYEWTPQTTLNIVSSVPEPGQGWMLAVGLAALAAAPVLRQRCRQRPATLRPA
jgi:MYXO-CTERM domain-containing protein